mmetsp:Transcript_29355/g.70867  ORF Transcript_29355/g.70867 Transcript_29355/m.70867 type:complete len:228 (+) Transcript_29355:1183-1866(+)
MDDLRPPRSGRALSLRRLHPRRCRSNITDSILLSVSFPHSTVSLTASIVSSLYFVPPLGPPNFIFLSGNRESSPKTSPAFRTRSRSGYLSLKRSNIPSRTIMSAGSSTLSSSSYTTLPPRYPTLSMRAARSSYSKSSKSESRKRGMDFSRRRSFDRSTASLSDPMVRSRCSRDMTKRVVRHIAVAVSANLPPPSMTSVPNASPLSAIMLFFPPLPGESFTFPSLPTT